MEAEDVLSEELVGGSGAKLLDFQRGYLKALVDAGTSVAYVA